MGMTGWPSRLSITLGSAWIGTNGLDSGDAFLLDLHSLSENERIYTENGSDTAADDINRLKIKVTWTQVMEDTGTASMTIYASSSDAWDQAAVFSLLMSGTDYAFEALWSHVPQSALTRNCDTAWLDDSGADLNPEVLLTILAAWDTTPEPVRILLTPVAPTRVKSIAPTPLSIAVAPLAPLYVGPPPVVATVGAAALQLLPIRPTLVRIAIPTPVRLLIRPRTITRIVGADTTPAVIRLSPLAPGYVGRPPTVVTPAALSLRLTPGAPATLRGYSQEIRGLYRIFGPAQYRIYRQADSPPTPDGAPWATASSLPTTPADTFTADTLWYLGVSYTNGLFESAFRPTSFEGATPIDLDPAGQERSAPPSGPVLWSLSQAAGIVTIAAVYLEAPELEPATQWAIRYTVDGSTPPADTPTLTPSISDILEYALPVQTHGTVVTVRLQTRRLDGAAYTYSDNSDVQSLTIYATGPTAPSYADTWPGDLSQ